MTQVPPASDSLVRELLRRVEALEARINALEGAVPISPVDGPPGADTPPSSRAPESQPAPGAYPGFLPLAGRAFVIMAGAFLLRALTDGGYLTRALGTAVGMAYALVWLGLADRAGARGAARSAGVHGLVAALIGFPLLGEAVFRHHVFSVTAAAVILTVYASLGLAIAWKHRLGVMAWMFGLGAAVALAVVAANTRTVLPYAYALLVLGLITWWIGYSRDWHGLAWTISLLVDGAVLTLVTALIVGPHAEERGGLPPVPVLGLLLGVVVVYVGSIAARTLLRSRDVNPREVIQTLLALSIGVGGALVVAGTAPHVATLVGLGCLAAAAGCYGAAFTVIDRRAGSRLNFLFYTFLALVFALIAGPTLLARGLTGGVFAVLALGTTLLGARHARATLHVHAAIYILVAAGFSGMLARGIQLLLGLGGGAGTWSPAASLVSLGVAAIMTVVPVSPHGTTWGRLAPATRLAPIIVLVLGVDGLLVMGGRTLLGERGTAGADPGLVAAMRSTILAVTAIAAAMAARLPRLREAGWLVYPILALGAIKLLADDFRHGRAVTLFVALAAYGIALLVVSRFTRKGPAAPASAPRP